MTIAPITIGPKNAKVVTGASWEWVRDRAVALGVPLLGTKKKAVISAAAFLAALEREASVDGGTASVARNGGTDTTIADPAAALRERLGLRLVGSR